MQDVIETIDNALRDHVVSGDAMRWTPDARLSPDPPQRVGRAFRSMMVMSAEYAARYEAAMAQAATVFGDAAREIEAWAEQMRAAGFDAVSAIHAATKLAHAERDDTAPLSRLGVLAGEPADDPRGRALRLRRTRNTGPEQPHPKRT